MRQHAILVVSLLWLVLPVELRADIILSAAGLNNTLKTMERLHRQMAAGRPGERAEALFQVGFEGDALASLLNDEVAAHGSQEKPLIDLALSRTRELGVAIAYNREKQKFFYDGAAFRQYLKEAPKGPRAAEATFKVIEGEFFQSSATDAAALASAAERKADFLRRYPKFPSSVEVSLMLAIDYRDLYRHYEGAGDVANRDRFGELTRKQLQATVRRHPGTEQAQIAAELLRRFEAELRSRGRHR